LNQRRFLVYICAVLLFVWSIVPIYWVMNQSLMLGSDALYVPAYFFPKDPTLANYYRIFGYSVETKYGTIRPSGFAPQVMKGMINSLLVSIPVTLITMAVATPVGYALGRYKFRSKNLLVMLLLGSRALPPVAIVIPYFYLYQFLGLINTVQGLIIIYTSITIPIITWVLIGFFATLPKDMELAARMDGCGRFTALRRIVIPMASSGLAASAILAFLLSWNEFLYSMILTAGSTAQTLPPVLPAMLFMQFDATALFSATVLTLIPPIFVALFFQKYILQLKLVDPVTV